MSHSKEPHWEHGFNILPETQKYDSFFVQDWPIIQAERDQLRAQLAEAKKENQCDACAGEGVAVSGPCMCGGSGKMSNAAVYLRQQLTETKAALANEKSEHEQFRSYIEGAPFGATNTSRIKELEQERDEWKRLYDAQADHHAAVEAKFEAALAEAKMRGDNFKTLYEQTDKLIREEYVKVTALTRERDHFRQLSEDLAREKNVSPNETLLLRIEELTRDRAEWKRIAGERERRIVALRNALNKALGGLRMGTPLYESVATLLANDKEGV